MTGAVNPPGQVEYGDFQTPEVLARRVIEVVQRRGVQYRTVIEPTCGVGNILYAAADHLPGLDRALGVEVNSAYVARASARQAAVPVQVKQGDFFSLSLEEMTATLPRPYIFVGNPPWVTNAAIGQLEGHNLPKKENFAGLAGFDALTGKSNFDVSEWIMLRLLENVAGTDNACAMLLKTSVARKIIAHAAKRRLAVKGFELYAIDAMREFGVAVSAGLLIFQGTMLAADINYTHIAYRNLAGDDPTQVAYINGQFVDDHDAYQRTQKYATKRKGQWRSGIKHDAAKVMELRRLADDLITLAGDVLHIEPDLVYPLLKSSDVAKGNLTPRLYTIMTQRAIGAETGYIQEAYPLTWAYLNEHRNVFDGRKSSIYRGKPPFSIFGVGDYSFAPYKIAISGLYKTLQFTLLETLDGKPIMVDDTCYILGFDDRVTSLIYLSALKHPISRDFFNARIQWDEKRPVKKDVLDSFDVVAFIRDNVNEVAVVAQQHGVTMADFEQWLNDQHHEQLF